MGSKSVIYFGTILVVLVTIACAKDCENFPELNKTLKPGEKISIPGKCQEATCHEDGSIGALGCALFVPGAGYEASRTDYSKPYPECCPKSVPIKNS